MSIKGYKDANGNIQKYDINALDAPFTAEVGQVLVVESVDENGYPNGFRVGESVDNLVKNTDYATQNKAGVARIYGTGDKNAPGVGMTGNNILGIVPAKTEEIDEKTNASKPIVPSTLDYAVKTGMTTNALEWTEEEKKSARDLLGASDSGIEITSGEPTKESTVLTLNPNAEEVKLYTAEEIDAKVPTWRTIREFDISNEEGIATDNSGITWTVDDSGNITAFEFDTDADGQTLSANKLRWCIYPQDPVVNSCAIFGGKRGYLNVFCNSNANSIYTGSIYNSTNTVGGHRIEGLIECDLSGILRQVSYMGADRNSYGNEKPHMNFFNIPGLGYATPPIQKFKIACDSGIWFVSGAKVLVQVCEEV